MSTLTSLAAPSLTKIGEKLNLTILNALNTLSFPQLTEVGSIYWVTLPELSELQFNTGVQKASDVYISDTGLTSLSGITLSECNSFDVNNNRYIQNVTTDFTSVSDHLEVSYNAREVSVSFPKLKWASNITLWSVSDISMPQLQSVNSSLNINNNSISGLTVPKLSTAGGVNIISNSQLTNLSFPELTKINGGFVISNNTALKSIVGFPKLEEVSGAITFVGNFSKAEIPNLDLVSGAVDIESDSTDFNCSFWNGLNSDGDIHGDNYVCKAASTSTSVDNPASNTGSAGSARTGSASATGDSESSSTSKGDAGVGVAVEYSSVLGAVFALLFQLV